MRLTAERLEKWLQYVLLGLVVFSVLWKGGKSLEATWLFAGVVAVMALVQWFLWTKRTDTKEETDVPHTAWLFVAGFVLWTAMSYLLSKTMNYGLDEVFREVAQMLIGFWVLRLSLRDRSENGFMGQFCTALTIATFIACGVGLFVYLFQPVDRFVGSFFDYRFNTDYWPNAWAEFLLQTWPVAIYTLRRTSLPLRTIASGILLASLLLSYSRGATIAFAGQLIVGIALLLLLLRTKKQNWNRAWWKDACLQSVGTVIVAVALFFGINAVRAQFHTVQSVGEKVTFTASEGTSSINERSMFMKQAFTLSWEHPIVGWGPYSFRFVQPRMQTGVFETSDHPHNLFLKLAMERGWPALFLFLGILFCVLVAAIKGYQSFKDAQDLELLLVAVVGGTGILAHVMIDYNLQFVGIALPHLILAGYVLSFAAVKQPKESLRRRHASWETAFAALLLFALVHEGYYLVTSSLGRRAEVRGNVEEALNWYDRSEGQWFTRDMLLGKAGLLQQSGQTKEALQVIHHSLITNSQDARTWIVKGELELAEKNFMDASRSFMVAMSFGQYNYLRAVEGMLNTLVASNEPATVRNAFKKDLDRLLGAYGNAILKNAHFIALSANVEDFERLVHLAAQTYPEDKATLEAKLKPVLEHAKAERERFTERAPGYLW